MDKFPLGAVHRILVEKETLRCVSNNEGRAYAIAGVVLFVIAATGLAVWLFCEVERVIRHAKRAEEAATAQQRRQQMEIEMAARTAILQAM